MPLHINTLLFILLLGLSSLYISKKAFASVIAEDEFLRWRNSWVILTSMAFLAGNYWIFMGACIPVILYCLKKVDDRFSFYLLILFIVPPFIIRIPGFLDITYARMLGLVILMPVLFFKNLRPNTPPIGRPLADKLILALVILTTLLQLRGTTLGDSLRTGVVFFIDWFLPYFAASRLIISFDQLKKILITLSVACSIIGIIGAFENAKSWLLYNVLGSALKIDDADHGVATMGIERGNELRAMATLDHPLSFGFTMMVALGIYFFVSSFIKSKTLKWLYFFIVIAGLYAPVSRGPWLAGVVATIIFLASGKKALAKLSALLVGGVIVILLLPSLPGGQKMLDLLPFIGKSEQFNVEYRQVLIPKSISIIKRNPFFGVFDETLEPEMNDMLQGQKIIDVVNSYLNITLNTGLVGLTLFLFFFVHILLNLLKSMKYIRNRNSEEYLCGRSLAATMIAVFVAISSINFGSSLSTVVYIMAGIMFSYSRIIINQARNRVTPN